MAIAVKLQVSSNGSVKTAIEFDDGRAKGDPFQQTTIPFGQWVTELESLITNMNDLVNKGNPGLVPLPISDRIPIDIEYAFTDANTFIATASIKGTPSLNATHTFDVVNKTITIERPGAFNVEWRAWQLYMQSLREFATLIKLIFVL